MNALLCDFVYSALALIVEITLAKQSCWLAAGLSSNVAVTVSVAVADQAMVAFVCCYIMCGACCYHKNHRNTIRQNCVPPPSLPLPFLLF